MRSRYAASAVVALTVLLSIAITPAFAQRSRKKQKRQPQQQQLGSSATNVSAELTRGKLNPAESKPGDELTIRLRDDLRSNGEIVLEKGTRITGVVRSVNRGDAQSLVAIEWFAPTGSDTSRHELMLAVQSLTQVSPLYTSRQEPDPDWDVATAAPASAGNAGGMRTASKTNAALLSMPSVVAADAKTSASLQSNLGLSREQKLFHTGKGEVVTAGGSRQSIDIFSHLKNDTVLTSKSKDFEISSGAQIQLLVGVRKN